ncbi:MAG: ATP-dependent helicase [Firmicutes bacterium]|nr:ATP-dependent helicase [Bacillota bacterium]
MLTEIQKEIAEAPLGAMLVTAGAGSGKTRVLVQRIIHLLQTGIRDYEIAALTFTNKAGKEMKERIEQTCGGRVELFLGTFHSFCMRTLRRYIDVLGYTQDFSIYDEKDKDKVIKEILASNNFYDLAKDGNKTVEYHLSQMKNEGTSLKEYEKKIAHYTNCDDIIKAISLYEQKMKASNALDFDDLLIKTLELFTKSPDVLEQLQNRYKYILVDEFQDTNHIQYQIVKHLANKHKNIMVVGDEDQCIYSWRGASIDNLKLFINDFSPRVYKLEQNFRSGKNIVDFANKLIQCNSNRIDKTLFSKLDDGVIKVEKFYDDREEAKTIVLKILEQIRYSGKKPSQFAILLRINALSRIFEDQLLNYNLPYAIWGGFKFYDRAEVKQALSYLKLLANPNDDVAFKTAISMPKRGVGEGTLDKIKVEDKNLLESCSDANITGKAKDGIISFRGVIERLAQTYEKDGLETLAEKFLDITRLRSAYDTAKEDDGKKADNLDELVNAIVQFAQTNPEATLSQYLQSVTLDVGEENDAGARVVVSTIHKAKGLEFDYVFLPTMEDGILPLERAKETEREMEEERRLLYVAITRARRELYVSYCSSRFLRGGRNFMNPSRFLADCGHMVAEEKPFVSYTPQQTFTPTFSYKNVISSAPKQATTQSFSVGDMVTHDKFGSGEIQEVIDKSIVKVKFRTVGIKMLSIAFANLKKI